jgi:hypothetical protein
MHGGLSPCRAEVAPAQKGSRHAVPPNPGKGPEPQQTAAPSKGKQSPGAGPKGAKQSPRPGKGCWQDPGKGKGPALRGSKPPASPPQTPAAWLCGREAALVSQSGANGASAPCSKGQSSGSAKGMSGKGHAAKGPQTAGA